MNGAEDDSSGPESMCLLGYGSLLKGFELGFLLRVRGTRNSSGMFCPFPMARFMCRLTCRFNEDGSVQEKLHFPSAFSGQGQLQI